jgi:CBS domain-containing protein
MSLKDKVSGLVIEDVYQVRPESSAREAAALMIEKDVSGLIVSGGRGPLGMITDKDMLRKVIAVGADPGKVKVESMMSFPLIAIGPEATIGEAAEKMVERRIKRLAVIDERGTFVGLVTMTDIIAWMARQKELSDSLVNYFLYDVHGT